MIDTPPPAALTAVASNPLVADRAEADAFAAFTSTTAG